MKNFVYNIPTKILFGQGQISKLGKEIKHYGNRVLLLYGKTSIKKIGLYDEILKYLKKDDIQIIELSGVDPNPRLKTVRKGAKLCVENNIDIILAVGGGSTIDCAKAIAAQSKYDGDIWTDLCVNKNFQLLKKALPVASVLTLSATGSEMNGNSVISNMEDGLKLSFSSDLVRPVFSILDPIYTYSVNKYQTAAGIVDIMSHIFEQYFSAETDGYLQNRLAEGVLKTVIKYGSIAYNNPKDYEARANIMWASSLALNGLLTYGKMSTDWATHQMEHELSAKYDITHGIGLAILTPNWMSYVLNESNVHRFVDYANNVWGIYGDDKFETAKKSIKETKKFFKSLNVPTTLSEIGIDSSKFEEMAKNCTKLNTIGSMKNLDSNDILNIFKMSLI